ncbi:MAG: hypothetical protein AAB627_00990 [Patescibacteria group bacterium]
MNESKMANVLPDFFRPLMWSYDFDLLDLIKNKKIIILNTINYGDLKHWRWVINYYGKNEVKKVLESIPVWALRGRVRKLVSLIFSPDLNYALRGTK